MPRHILAFDYWVADVYLYHNWPAGKVYLDARLEMPTEETFRTYLALMKKLLNNSPDWTEAVRAVGNPALFVLHKQFNGITSNVIAHPGWRLVYLDALAAVLVPRGDPEADRAIPTFDLAGRHFRAPGEPSIPDAPGAAFKEMSVLSSLAGRAIQPETTWTTRIPAGLSAIDRAVIAQNEPESHAQFWKVLSSCYMALLPDLRVPPPSLAAGWDAYSGIRWAQSTYCLRQALIHTPTHEASLKSLSSSFRVRRMADALRSVSLVLLEAGHLSGDEAQLARQFADRVGPPLEFRAGLDPVQTIGLLLGDGRPEDATRYADSLPGRALPWPLADAVAGAWLHLGYPDRARRVWQAASGPPSEAIRLARVASSYWAERDYTAAEQTYLQVRQAAPELLEPHWALAWIATELGRAGQAAESARAALGRSPPPTVQTELTALLAFLARYPETGR
jgi:hypothetical protein